MPLLARIRIVFISFLALSAAGSGVWAQSPGSIHGEVSTLAADGSAEPLPQASVLLRCEGGVSKHSTSDEQGQYLFDEVKPGKCTVTASAEGFRPDTQDVEVASAKATVTNFQLLLSAVQSSVSVTAAAPGGVDTSTTGTATTELSQATLQAAPLVSERFQEALPLTPGVVRGPDGLIDIKGARPGQSGTLVDSVSGVDPVTGQAATSLPLESVESVKVLPNPFSPEYGRFAGGVTEVETRSGDDTWRYLLTNFFPRFRWRDGGPWGLESITPRLTVAGPLDPGKLFIFQSFDYRFVRVPVESLPPQARDQQFETFDSSTQFDWIESQNNRVSGLVVLSPQNLEFVNLNTFNPEPTTADFRQRGYQVTLNDNAILGGSVLQSHFSAKRYDVHVFPSSGESGALELFPEQNSGDWYDRQDRNSWLYQWSQVYRLADRQALGKHSISLGYDYEHAHYDGSVENEPVRVVREDRTLSQTIAFPGPGHLQATANTSAFFVQDHWAPVQRFALDLGVRLDHDGASNQALNAAPRLGFVFVPTRDSKTAVRGGIGLFYDKIPLDVTTFTQYPAESITQYAADGTTVISGPTTFGHLVVAPHGLRVPYSVAWNFQADRELGHGVMVRFGYEQRQTHRDYLVEPVSLPVPALELLNHGTQAYREFQAMVRWRATERTLIYFSYVRSRARGDLNTFGQFFDNFPNPIIRQNEYGPLPYDAPNRFLAWGVLGLPWKVEFSPLLDVHDGFPYSRVDNDLNFVGRRNQGGQFPEFASLDVKLVRAFRIHWHRHHPVVKAGIKVFNLTNHFNPRDVQDNIASPNFGDFYNGVGRQFRGKFEFNF